MSGGRGGRGVDAVSERDRGGGVGVDAGDRCSLGVLVLVVALGDLPEAIPLYLLLQSRPGLADKLGPEVAPVLVPLMEDSVAAKDAIAGLRRYSLISPSADGAVSVHRLVQAITVARMLEELAAAWRQAAAAVIEAALPENPGDPAVWPVMAVLLPHAQAALAPASYGMDKIVTYLRAIGNYGAALGLQRQILDACQADLGAEDRRTLTARARLATMTGEAGNLAAARDQFADLLPVLERVLGDNEHPAILTAHSNLAHWTAEAGNPAAACDEYAALLPVRERVSGAEYPRTLADRASLARLTGDMGDPAAARDQFAALLPVLERVLGAEHPDTLTARRSLIYWTRQAETPGQTPGLSGTGRYVRMYGTVRGTRWGYSLRARHLRAATVLERSASCARSRPKSRLGTVISWRVSRS